MVLKYRALAWLGEDCRVPIQGFQLPRGRSKGYPREGGSLVPLPFMMKCPALAVQPKASLKAAGAQYLGAAFRASFPLKPATPFVSPQVNGF